MDSPTNTEEFRVSSLIQASPNAIYTAWLDERKHSAITGSRATVEPWVGGRHTAWDGAVDAVFVELDTGRRLVMTWRTASFPADAYDSRVEVSLEPVAGGTKVTVFHTGVPEGLIEDCKREWRNHYLDPLKRFFGKPGAMRAAIRAASKARKLPIPGVTSARPGTVVSMRRLPPRPAPPPEEIEAPVPRTKTAKARPSAALSRSARTETARTRTPEKKTKARDKAVAARTLSASSRAATGTQAKPAKAKTTPPTAKKSPAKKAPAKKASKKAPAKKSAAKKSPAKKAPAKKASKKAPAKKSAAKKSPAKKAPAKKASKKAPAKKSAAKKSPAKKAPAKKASKKRR